MNDEILNEFAAYPWEAEALTDAEWWEQVFEILSASFFYVLDNDFLRLFAVLALLIVVVALLGRLLRLGRLR